MFVYDTVIPIQFDLKEFGILDEKQQEHKENVARKKRHATTCKTEHDCLTPNSKRAKSIEMNARKEIREQKRIIKESEKQTKKQLKIERKEQQQRQKEEEKKIKQEIRMKKKLSKQTQRPTKSVKTTSTCVNNNNNHNGDHSVVNASNRNTDSTNNNNNNNNNNSDIKLSATALQILGPAPKQVQVTIRSPESFTSYETELYKNLQKFYTDDKNYIETIILPLCDKDTKSHDSENTLSLRTVNYLVTNYARLVPCEIIIQSDTKMNISSSYDSELLKYTKKYFDPFRRHWRIFWRINERVNLITTLAQLNFFRWAIENKILTYAETNRVAIESHMKQSHQRLKMASKANLLLLREIAATCHNNDNDNNT